MLWNVATSTFSGTTPSPSPERCVCRSLTYGSLSNASSSSSLFIEVQSVKDEEQRLEEQLQAVDAEIESLGDTSRDESAVRQCTTLSH